MSLISVEKFSFKSAGVWLFVVLLWLCSTTIVNAQDTDTAGVVFTDITTATDSLENAVKDTQQMVKAASPAIAPVTATQAPKSLWTILLQDSWVASLHF